MNYVDFLPSNPDHHVDPYRWACAVVHAPNPSVQSAGPAEVAEVYVPHDTIAYRGSPRPTRVFLNDSATALVEATEELRRDAGLLTHSQTPLPASYKEVRTVSEEDGL